MDRRGAVDQMRMDGGGGCCCSCGGGGVRVDGCRRVRGRRGYDEGYAQTTLQEGGTRQQYAGDDGKSTGGHEQENKKPLDKLDNTAVNKARTLRSGFLEKLGGGHRTIPWGGGRRVCGGFGRCCRGFDEDGRSGGGACGGGGRRGQGGGGDE